MAFKNMKLSPLSVVVSFAMAVMLCTGPLPGQDEPLTVPKVMTPHLAWKYGWEDGKLANTIGTIKRGSPLPTPLTVLGPGSYTPADISAAYGYNLIPAPGDGRGITIAIIDAYGSPNIQSDLDTFCAQFGIPSTTVNVVYPNGNPGFNAGWATETTLDVEWAHALAPGATIALVAAKSASSGDLAAAINYATQTLGAQIVSMSFGAPESGGEPAFWNPVFNKSGVAFVASAGDSDAQVNWPAAQTNVLGVGGTSLQYNATLQAITSETVWNNGPGKGTGGGISSQLSRPPYQTTWNSNSLRGIPDVSAVADPYTGGYVYFTPPGSSGGWYNVGGTSWSAPEWAALLACRASLGNATISAINSQLYSQAISVGSPNYGASFRDITVGNNGGYSAKVGYDYCTGLGSPNASVIANPSQVVVTFTGTNGPVINKKLFGVNLQAGLGSAPRFMPTNNPTGNVYTSWGSGNSNNAWTSARTWLPQYFPTTLPDMGVTVMRYPGGHDTSFWHWFDAWHPWDLDPYEWFFAQNDGGASTRAVRSQSNNYGEDMDLDQYMTQCINLKTEPLVGCNLLAGARFGKYSTLLPSYYTNLPYLGDPVKETVAMLQYCQTKYPNTPVNYVYLDNEVGGAGADGTTNADHVTTNAYPQMVQDCSTAIKGAFPNVKTIISYNGNVPLAVQNALIATKGQYVDIIDRHQYYAYNGYSRSNYLADTTDSLDGFPAMIQTIYANNKSAGFTNIKVAINEWNVTINPSTNNGGNYFDQLLVMTDMLMMFVRNNVEMACMWPLYSPNFLNSIIRPDQGYSLHAPVYGMKLFKDIQGQVTQNQISSTNDLIVMSAQQNPNSMGGGTTIPNLQIVMLSKNTNASRSVTLDLRAFLSQSNYAAVSASGFSYVENTGIPDYFESNALTANISNGKVVAILPGLSVSKLSVALAVASPTPTPTPTPTPPSTLPVLVEWGGVPDFIPPEAQSASIKQISLGAGNSVNSSVLTASGQVIVWGPGSSTNVPSSASNGVSAISLGYSHILALKNNGVIAWGDQTSGATTVPSNAISGVVAISAGWWSGLALKTNGTVVAWGNKYDAASSRAYHDAMLSIAAINVGASINPVVGISDGYNQGMVLLADGTVRVFGSSFLNLSATAKTDLPLGLTGVAAISEGRDFALALKKDGTVVAWGDNSHGQCDVPKGLKGVVSISAGGFHALALKSDGTVVAWGDNSVGQSTVPTGLNKITAVEAGRYHSLASRQGKGDCQTGGGSGGGGGAPGQRVPPAPRTPPGSPGTGGGGVGGVGTRGSGVASGRSGPAPRSGSLGR